MQRVISPKYMVIKLPSGQSNNCTSAVVAIFLLRWALSGVSRTFCKRHFLHRCISVINITSTFGNLREQEFTLAAKDFTLAICLHRMVNSLFTSNGKLNFSFLIGFLFSYWILGCTSHGILFPFAQSHLVLSFISFIEFIYV